MRKKVLFKIKEDLTDLFIMKDRIINMNMKNNNFAEKKIWIC